MQIKMARLLFIGGLGMILVHAPKVKLEGWLEAAAGFSRVAKGFLLLAAGFDQPT